MVKQRTHLSLLERQPKKVTNLEKEVVVEAATKDVAGIEVLKEERRSMAKRPKMMIALRASVNPVPPEIISDRGVKGK